MAPSVPFGHRRREAGAGVRHEDAAGARGSDVDGADVDGAADEREQARQVLNSARGAGVARELTMTSQPAPSASSSEVEGSTSLAVTRTSASADRRASARSPQ
jgi:hypothetical protein